MNRSSLEQKSMLKMFSTCQQTDKWKHCVWVTEYFHCLTEASLFSHMWRALSHLPVSSLLCLHGDEGFPTKTPSAPPFHSKLTTTPTNWSTGSEQRENEWEWGFPMNIALDVWKGILRTCCITSWQEMETWNTGIRSTCGMCMWSTKGFGKILFHTNQET